MAMRKGSSIVFAMPWHITERGGGAEVQANYLSQELAKRGFKVSYICQTIEPNKVDTVETIGQVSVYWLRPSGRFPWRDQNKYLAPLREIQPDYILQRLSSNVSYVLGNFAKKNKCQFIWVCTDNMSPFKDFHQAKFKKYFSVKKLGFLKYNVFLMNAKIMDWYRNKGMSHVDLALHQNKTQKALLKKEFGLDSQKLISGHPEPQRTLEANERFQKKTILWCANFGRHKRPTMFVELAKRLEHTDYNFIMVGGHSDKAYVASILKDAPNDLKTTGHLSFDDALNYFSEASIFVNTSAPGGDGFPNTYIQSWLRGVPVISFGFDPDHVIAQNNLGTVVDNVDEAMIAIERWLSSAPEYVKKSNAIVDFAKSHYTIEKLTDSFLELIATIDAKNL
ncbi:MAG: glycosyltransferase family 4 protein [Algicola sp.]|nr:glycosyltransferase family 4 protein [Algicola sp.]